MFNFVDPDRETAILAGKKLNLDQINTGRMMAPDVTQRLVGIQKNWGWLPPSVSLGFAQSGYNQDSPEVRSAANLELMRRARTQQITGDNTAIRNTTKLDPLAHLDAAGLDDLASNAKQMKQMGVTKDQVMHALNQAGGNKGGGGGGGGFLGTGVGPDVSLPHLGTDLGYSAQRLLRGDVAGAIGGGGAEQASPGDVTQNTANVRGAVRLGTTAMQTVSQEGQGFIRQGAQGVKQIATGDIGGLLGGTPQNPATDPYQQSVGGQALDEVQRGESVDLGKGLLPDPNSAAAKASVQAQLAAGPTIGGHTFTLGRGTAWTLNEAINSAASPWGAKPNLLEPDSTGFNIVSGGVDAFYAMHGDPAAQVLIDASEGRKAAQAFAPVEGALAPAADRVTESGSSILDNALRTTGVEAPNLVHKPATWDALAASNPQEYLSEVNRTFGKSVMAEVRSSSGFDTATSKLVGAGAQQAYEGAGAFQGQGARPFMAKTGLTPEQWYTSPVGNTVIRRMAAESSPSNMIRDFGIPAVTVNGDPIAARVAGESDPNEVLNILKPYFGTDITGPIKLPGGFAYGVRRGLSNIPGGNTVERALTGLMPGHYIDPQDKGNTFKAVDQYLQSANIGLNDRNKILDSFLNAQGPDDTYQSIKLASDAVKAQLRAHGMTDEKEIVRLGNLFPDAAQQSRLYDLNQITRGENLHSGVVVEGNGNVLPSPQYTTESLNSLIELPDAREIRRATSTFEPLVNSKPWKATSAIMDSFLRFWTSAHLLHPGLGARVIGDSQASLAANGFDSLFTHPLNTVSAIIGGNLDQRWAQVMEDPRWGARAFLDGDLPFLRTIGKGVANLPEHVGSVAGKLTGDEAFGQYVSELGQKAQEGAANLIGNTAGAALGKVTDRLLNPMMAFDSMNHPMVSGYDDVERAIHGGWSAVEDPSKVALAGYHPVSRGDPEFARGLVDELARASGDPRVRGFLQAGSPEAAQEWFWSGEGAALREKGIPLARQINEANMAKAASLGDGAYHVPLDFETPEGSNKFVSEILDRVERTTGGNAELRDSILTGKLGDINLRTGRLGSSTANPDALDRINELADQGIGPEATKARDTVTLSRDGKLQDRMLKTKMLRSLFDHMMAEPDAAFDRIPAYQQAYWKHASDYLPYLDNTPIKVGGVLTTPRELVLQRAGEQLPESSVYSDVMGGNSQQFLKDLRNAPVDTGDTQKLTLDQFHTLTKGAALDEIPRVVHDLSTRSQFFDMTRMLFPFGDAFRRIAQRWVTTAWEHPNILRRAQQGITAARSSGFFHVDPTTGQEVFTYPGSEWLTNKLIGVPVPLTGQVSGLSMVGEGLPGVGPAVTIPAQYFLPDTPNVDNVRNVIFPYGQQPNVTRSGSPATSCTSLVPPAADKVMAGLMNTYHDQKAYNTIVGSMMRYDASTGNYDLRGEHGKDPKAETDRHDLRRQGASQVVLRASVARRRASRRRRRRRSTRCRTRPAIYRSWTRSSTSTATCRPSRDRTPRSTGWSRTTACDNVFIAQPFSKPIVYGVPVTKQGHDWATSNPDMTSKYPNSYGFFAPQVDANGKPFKFDITAFEDQFIRGERTSLGPEDFVKEANNRIGMWLYHKQRDNILTSNGGDAPDQGQQAWLNNYKKQLATALPGFNLVPYDDKKLPRTISELEAAAKDPTLASNDATQGLKLYLQSRAEANAQAVEDGYKDTMKARAEAPNRDWLRDEAAAIIKQHPDFAPMWEQVLSHEMVFDSTPAGAAPTYTTTGGAGGSSNRGSSGGFANTRQEG